MNLFEKIAKLQQSIYAKRPALESIIVKNRNKSALEYAQDLHVYETEVPEGRQSELISVIAGVTGRLLGNNRAQSVKKQLEKYYSVTTADHLGILTHPFFVSSNLLQTAIEQPGYENVVVLACGNVSLGNSSYPRGLLMQTEIESGTALNRFALFPWAYRHYPVCGLKAFNNEQVKSTLDLLRSTLSKSLLSKTRQDVLLNKLQTWLTKPEVLDSRYFSEQVTRVNFNFWDNLANEQKVSIPSLVYLELEEVVTQLLLKHHIFAQTEISELFFNGETQESLKHFANGTPGAFSLENNSGSFLFWGIDKKNKKRRSMWKVGEELMSEGGDVVVKLNPKEMEDALLNKQIVPSTLLCFFVLVGYYRLKCLGGFSQTTYLPKMMEVYNAIFPNAIESEVIDSTCRGFCCDVILAYALSRQSNLLPACGMDILAYAETDFWSSFKKTAASLNLEEAMLPLLPELYRILYPEKGRLQSLLSVTLAEIIQKTDLKNKITPCLKMF